MIPERREGVRRMKVKRLINRLVQWLKDHGLSAEDIPLLAIN